MYLLVLVEYPETENFETGVRVLEDFHDRLAVIPENWRILPGKLPIVYELIPEEAPCYFPTGDHYSTLEEIQELIRSQANPQPDWYLLNSNVIKLYGNSCKYLIVILEIFNART